MQVLIGVMAASLSGVTCGILTGLIPGIHINLVSSIVVSIAPALLKIAGPECIVAFIVSMSTTHTFFDIIPTIFLGAPSSDTALGVLPGHRMLIKGEGLKAVKLSQAGGLLAAVISVGLYPLFRRIIAATALTVKEWMPVMLLTTIIFLILISRKRVMTTAIFLLAGALGLAALRTRNSLFPLLSGLFGLATLAASENRIPSQKEDVDINNYFKKDCFRSAVVGEVAGFMTAVLPGLGSSSAAAIASAFSKMKEEPFMVLIGAIGTVNFILSIATYEVIGKARNGSIAAISELFGGPSPEMILVSLGGVLLASGVASLMLCLSAKRIALIISMMPYSAIIKGVFFMIILMTAILSGWQGLLILVSATALGLIAPRVGVSRAYLMGCLLVPVTIFFL